MNDPTKTITVTKIMCAIGLIALVMGPLVLYFAFDLKYMMIVDRTIMLLLVLFAISANRAKKK